MLTATDCMEVNPSFRVRRQEIVHDCIDDEQVATNGEMLCIIYNRSVEDKTDEAVIHSKNTIGE